MWVHSQLIYRANNVGTLPTYYYNSKACIEGKI